MPRRGEAYTRAKVQIGNPEMILRAGRVLRNPTLLVTAIALLAAALVQSGELGSSDTTHRCRPPTPFGHPSLRSFPMSIRTLASMAGVASSMDGMASANRF